MNAGHATPVTDAIRILAVEKCDGTTFLTIDCRDWDVMRGLPKLVSFDGRVFGKTGWNSDRGIAYYSDAVRIARHTA